MKTRKPAAKHREGTKRMPHKKAALRKELSKARRRIGEDKPNRNVLANFDKDFLSFRVNACRILYTDLPVKEDDPAGKVRVQVSLRMSDTENHVLGVIEERPRLTYFDARVVFALVKEDDKYFQTKRVYVRTRRGWSDAPLHEFSYDLFPKKEV